MHWQAVEVARSDEHGCLVFIDEIDVITVCFAGFLDHCMTLIAIDYIVMAVANNFPLNTVTINNVADAMCSQSERRRREKWSGE